MINSYEIQREESLKFLVVLLGQHWTSKEHVKLIGSNWKCQIKLELAKIIDMSRKTIP